MSGLLRSNLVVATGTMLSRVSGLLRIMVFGWIIGQTALSDAYLIANETPNIVYDLLLGGVLSATLVPLFSTFVETDDEEATNVVITVAATLMVALTAVAVVAAPLIFRLYTITPGEDVDPQVLRQVGTMLARIFLVQILFYGLTGLANAFLNSRRRFFAAAWSPVVSNVVIIATLLTLRDRAWELGDVVTNGRLRWTLGLGATGGIAAMAVIVVVAAARTGFRFRPVWNWRHPVVRKLLVLSGWTLGFVAANQVALIVVRNLAQPGSSNATAYFVAFTFFVLPHGLLAVSISTTFQPEMARAVARKDKAAFIDQTGLGVRLIALLTLPAGFAIFTLRDPIVGALLQYRNFDAEDAANTADALAGFSLGLVGFSVYLFVLRGFYAHQDTRTPFVVNVVENALNIVIALLLVGEYGVLGLGLAYAIAYLVSAVWVLHILTYKVRGFSLRPIWASGWRMLLAAVLMAEAIWFVTHGVSSDTGVQALVQLLVGGAVGLVVYVGVLIALRAPELDWAKRRVTRS
ncbi:MAG TPA: murein biosynthesis integral membrane protein MurJ [Ilumatobacter sp.]|nr:murein biosynthesis integral membrane protein MurJ [Ilumatobacter sp.]